MYSKYLLCLFLICVFCFSLQAQERKVIICDKPSDEKDFKRWLEKDVLYIITKNEKELFLKLTTNKEREIFVQNFWLRRDPTLDTEENEFFDEYYERIAYTNEHFASSIQGWRTDRGLIYIAFGKPDRIEKGRGDFENVKDILFEKWYFKYADGLCSGAEFTFIDPTESNEFRLQKGNRESLLKSMGNGLTIYIGPCHQESF